MRKTKPLAGGRDAIRAVPGTPHLFVRTHPSGVESFVFRFRKGGRNLKAALGDVNTLPLEDARKTVAIYVGEIARDIDPIAKRKEEAKRRRVEIDAARRAKLAAAEEIVFTVGALIKAWAASRGEGDKRSVRYLVATRTTLETTLAPVLHLAAKDLGAARIAELVEAVAKDRGPSAAARAQDAINQAFRRAIKIGKLIGNPCATLDRRSTSPRQRTLAAAEIQRIWRAAEALPAVWKAYVRFLLATGVRRNEVLYARWSEIEGDLWHIPAHRMKAKRSFTVPLTGAALRALPVRGNAGDFIFSLTNGAKAIGGLHRVKTALDVGVKADGAGPLAPWTFHHIRHALATWLGDRGVDYTICNLCLAHGIPLDRSGQTYQRSYKILERRAALDKWASLLDPEPVRKGRKTALRVVA
jgi:integrase